jgi:hypothetical protein
MQPVRPGRKIYPVKCTACAGKGKITDANWGGLLFVLRPASLTALAFKHADDPAVLGVQHLPDESRLSPALAQANWMLGGGTCKLSVAEIVHGLTPLSEFKLRSEQTFLICLSDLQFRMERKSEIGRSAILRRTPRVKTDSADWLTFQTQSWRL